MILNNNIYIGEVKEDSTKVFEIKLKDSKVKKVKPKCNSCTKVLSFDNEIIKLQFKADYIPPYLNINRWELFKSIDIVYEDDTEERFTFRVVVIKND